MPILFRLHDSAKLFEFRYIGPLDYAMRARAVRQTQLRLKDGWVKQILIDFSESWAVEEPANEDDIDAFRRELVRATYPRGARVAFLNPPERYDEDALCVERLAHFVGRRFHDRRHALAWLRGRL